MRPVQLGAPPFTQAGLSMEPRVAQLERQMEWVIQALREIEVASQDDTNRLFDEFTPSNVTETRTFDADTVTLAELADVVGTLIDDVKGRLA